MKFFWSPFDPNLTLLGKARAFVITWCQVMISFIVIGYLIVIFRSEYKYAKDFIISHPKVVNIAGSNAKIILKPYTPALHVEGGHSTAHFDFFVFGEKTNGIASIDLETQDGFWSLKKAIFIPNDGQPISLEAEK